LRLLGHLELQQENTSTEERTRKSINSFVKDHLKPVVGTIRSINWNEKIFFLSDEEDLYLFRCFHLFIKYFTLSSSDLKDNLAALLQILYPDKGLPLHIRCLAAIGIGNYLEIHDDTMELQKIMTKAKSGITTIRGLIDALSESFYHFPCAEVLSEALSNIFRSKFISNVDAAVKLDDGEALSSY